MENLQKDLDKVIKPQLEEILRLLRDQSASNVSNIIEAAAAKIITEIKSAIQECPCKKKTLETYNEETSGEKQIVLKSEETSRISTGPLKYSYPNFDVGNEELGYGKNPNSMTWPFGQNQRKS